MSDIKMFFTPFESIEVEAAILSLLDSSTKTIHLALYGFTDEKMCDKLIEIHNKGVTVKIIMDATEAATLKQKALLGKLLKSGIMVAVGKSTINNQLLHCKMIAVDGRFIEWGSLNYSPSGLQQFNVCSFQEDTFLASRFIEAWEKIYQHIMEKNNAKPRFIWNLWNKTYSFWSYLRGSI